MSTIADRIIRADGVALNAGAVYFVPTATVVIGGAGVSSSVVSVATNSSGEFSVSLTPGLYRVRWRWSVSSLPDEVGVIVPDDSATYTLAELVTGSDAVASSAVLRARAGSDSLRSVSSPVNRQVEFLEYYETEGDGLGGWFKYDSDSSSDESVDVIRPASILAANPGRWLRVVYI